MLFYLQTEFTRKYVCKGGIGKIIALSLITPHFFHHQMSNETLPKTLPKKIMSLTILILSLPQDRCIP